MGFFNKKCQMCTVLWFGVVFVPIGLFLSLFWGTIYNKILKHELALSNTSKSYDLWKETPIPMYFSVYLFNWTNADEVIQKKWTIKPVFQECGPYVFSEHHIRVNLTWNNNDTVTYMQKRIWHFIPSKSKGNLTDNITNLNPVVAIVGNLVKNFGFFIKVGVNKILLHYEEGLLITKTVKELLYEGYSDEVLSKLHQYNIPGFNVPYSKFGWFYPRNNSETYDGNFTIYTGENDLSLLGILDLWNGAAKTTDYQGYCSYVNGTAELWPPVKNYEQLDIFSSDICSSLALKHSGEETLGDITGKKFAGTNYAFDNGTNYPEQACFKGQREVPSGVRDVSKCKFNAPAFISYPHFYLADPSYLQAIDGLHPNKSKHEMSMTLEPNTGIPLHILARMQLNLFVESISDMSIFDNVKKTFIPIMWFTQEAILTEELSNTVTELLKLSNLGLYMGWIVFSTGIVLTIIGIFLLYRKEWSEQEVRHLLEEEQQE